MRVHELAKTVGVPSKELMHELKKMKVPVEHHSNALDDETVRQVMAIYQARRGGGVVKKLTRRAGQPPAPGAPAAAPPSAAPPAPGAPRLVKRVVRQGPLRPITRPISGGAFAPPVVKAPSIAPISPPPLPPAAMRSAAPSTLKPPEPLHGPTLPPPQRPSAPTAPPAAAPPGDPSSPSAPPKPRRAAKRTPAKQDKPARGTTIDLDTFKTFVAKEVPGAAKPDKDARRREGQRRRRSGGERHPRRPDRRPARSDESAPQFRPSFVLHAPPPDRRRDSRRGAEAGRGGAERPSAPRVVTIYGQLSVGDFAEKLCVDATELIKKLMLMGEMITINSLLSDEMAELLAEECGIQLTIIPETDEYDVKEFVHEDQPEEMIARPPVATVMGHVDHGKTSLLDRIRETAVAEGESGGITQHIGASSVHTAKGDITFLDTPGHEAFSAMRARGADVTDLVVLVVAADDGVKPQTIEAINHAKAAEVSIIVAINKIDVPGANTTRVKQELMGHGLIGEEFGGDTICCEVSAKTGDGIEHLLEMIALQAEVLELQANPARHGEGIVIESRVEGGRGVTATVLVQRGTLRIGDAFLAGPESGKIRAMNDDRGRSIEEIGAGRAAEIFGLRGAPEAGEAFLVVPNERVAREIAERRTHRRRTVGFAAATPTSAVPTAVVDEETGEVTLTAPEEFKTLRVIVRGDVQGSVEAVSQSLLRLELEGVKLEVIHSGVGAITNSDINLAATAGALVIGFGVRPEPQAAQLAEDENVTIRLHRVIYELIDDAKATLAGMLDPTFREEIQGRAEVRQVFRVSKVGNVAGCQVVNGEIRRSHQVRLLRDDVVVTDRRRIASLRRVKDDVTKVTNGMECGIAIDGFNDIKEGDFIEAYTLERIETEVSVGTSA